MKTLIFGIGNSAREDDGAALFLVSLLKKKYINFHYKCAHQFQLEDAHLFSLFQRIVLIDASILKEKVLIKKILPSTGSTMESHIFSPSFLVTMCQNLFHKKPEIYLVSVKGYRFEIGNSLSFACKKNIRHAVREIEEKIFCLPKYSFRSKSFFWKKRNRTNRTFPNFYLSDSSRW